MPRERAIIPAAKALYDGIAAFNGDFEDAAYAVYFDVQSVINRYATGAILDPDGKVKRVVPVRNLREVLTQAGDTVQRLYVGPDYRHAYGRDGVTPLSPYARFLNEQITLATYRIVLAHGRYMRQRLPDDLIRWLEGAQYTPGPVYEQRRNPPPTYEPAHTWVDARGYRLSDRIWQASLSARIKIDTILAQGIREGTASIDLAFMLADYVLPNRQAVITRRPYGRKVQADAMRLARSEIARAANAASLQASRDNPFVRGVDYVLSHSHKLDPGDPCEAHATIWLDGTRRKDPYPSEKRVPVPVQDSHPNCICHLRAGEVVPTQEMIAELRSLRGQGAPPPVTPISTERYLTMLLGPFLVAMIWREVMAS